MMTGFGLAGAGTLVAIAFMIFISHGNGDKYTANYLKRDLLFLAIIFVSVGVVWPTVCWVSSH